MKYFLLPAAFLLSSLQAHGQQIELTPSAEESPATPSDPIPLQSPDEEIRARLAGLYADIEGLGGVRLNVRGGVVTLEGSTLEAGDRSKAEEVAGRVAGVVSVENKIAVEHRVDRRLAPLVHRTEEIGRQLIAFLPLLILAGLAFAGFWVLGRVLTRRTRVFKRLAPNAFIEALIEQVVRLVFILAGLVVAMSILGATALLGSVLGVAGVIGLAVGFAVRDTIENYIASILLSVRQPFAPNDAVIIEGFEGRITRLNSRATIITTWDGNEARIPNATVYKANIVNLTRTPERRFDFEVRIDLQEDISAALATALAAIRTVTGVLDEPSPSAIADRVDADAVILKIFAWVNQSKSDFGKTKSETIRAVKEAFDDQCIIIPEPTQRVRDIVEKAKPASSVQAPAAKDLREIKDTSKDKTIDNKVIAARAEPTEDLLSRRNEME